MLKISYAGCFGLSPAILVQFTLEMYVAAWNRKKFTKTPYFIQRWQRTIIVSTNWSKI